MTEPNYQTYSGEPVPDDVASEFDDPDEWGHHRLDPENVAVYDEYHMTHYEGMVDGSVCFVTDDGYVTRADRFDHPERLREGQLPSAFGTPCTYNDDVHVVHHDHYVEHVTRVIVALAPDTRIVLNSRSGVVWWRMHGEVADPADAPETAVRLAVALSDADSGVEMPEQFERALGGWHSSMESSEQSEMMNALSAADIPPHWCDDVDPFPYAVKYGDTRNVCSVNASVYAKPEAVELFKSEFADSGAAPGHAGFR